MSKKAKIIRWAGAALSLPASIYAGMSFIFYAWLNAADPERWPSEKAALWAYASLAIAIVFLVLFIFCAASLIKDANRKYREEQST